jgi:CubicO group peptidase (beta-lactamase class C family)/glycosyltransferase involved in cell wall biosynthesis
MLKIAQCTDSFLPIADGVGRVAYAYARSLAQRGHDVYAITPMVNDGYRGRYPFEILDYVTLPVPGTQQKTGVAALDMHYLARANTLRLDVVHAHSPGPAGMEAVRLADRLHVPLVGTFHPKYIREYLTATEDERQSMLTKSFAFDYFSRCDEIWTVSREARDFLIEHGFSGNIEVFDNGTELETADERARLRARETFHLTDDPALFFAGSLEPQKNLPRMLEAASILQRRGVRFQLLLAGHGPGEKQIRERVHALNLTGTVRFLGVVSDETLLSGLYAESALCLFPAQGITAGLIVREAAVQGTPSLVIAGSAPCKLIENGVNGLTCGDTAESMADAIEAYLGEPDRMREISLCAKQIAPVPWDAVIDRVIARYTELASMDRTTLKRKRGIFRKEMEKVDLTLEKRAMDLIWKYLTQDTQHLYVYPHQKQKPAFEALTEVRPLPRSTPEAEGVSSRAIDALVRAIDEDEAACAQEIMILRNGKVIAQAAWSPYDARLPHQLYSLSKSITSTAVGMLVDEDGIDLDEKLCDILFDKAPENEQHPAYKMTVRHLLNMSTGSYFNEAGSAMGADWEREFLHAGVKFAPGSAFEYNSMNTYMLAAIVRRKTGQTLTEYLLPRLYEPLGIRQHYWETCPNGTEKGGWGLSLTMESVAKIGQLYLNKGRWETPDGVKQLVGERWIDEATSAQIDTPNGEITYGYGHQIWMTARKGAFLFNGAFGQYMLALPDKNALVVLFSGTSRLFAQGGVLDQVTAALDTVQDVPLPKLPRDTKGVEALQATLNNLSVRKKQQYYTPVLRRIPIKTLADRLNGRVYSFPKNIGGVLPMILQSVHNNFTAGVSQVAFMNGDDGKLRLEFVEGMFTHRIAIGEEGYTSATVTQKDDTFEARVSAQTELLDAGAFALHVAIHFIETPFTRLIRLVFLEDTLKLTFDESPSVRDASEMMLELTGISRVQIVRNLLPLLKREKLQHTLRTFTTVTVQGTV